MNKKKKVIILIIAIVILVVIGVLILISPNLVKRLTGSVGDANSEGTATGEFINKVCNISVDNENFISVTGSIIEDSGDEGIAVITFKSDNKVFTKEVMVSSNNFVDFNYVFPRDTYSVTITKDGYETYETTIDDSTFLDVVLTNKDAGIIASNRLYVNTYYDFYSDGTVHIKAIGKLDYNDFETPSGLASLSNATLIVNFGFEYLANHGLNFNNASTGSDLGDTLTWVLYLTLFSGKPEIKQRFIEVYERYESGECNASNMSDSKCGNDLVLENPTDLNDVDYTKRYLKLLIDMPVVTDLVIDNDVVVLPILMGITAKELTINNTILYAIPNTFASTNIGTFNVNSNVLAQTENFAAVAKINNLVIGNAVTSIGESAFTEAEIDNITLPISLVEIKSNAFSDANINTMTIPNNVKVIDDNAFSGSTISNIKLSNKLETIGERAFYNTKLTSITIPSSVETIGQNAFSGAPLTEVIIEGDKTRFNDKWASIGFPSELKPSE